MFSLTLTPDTLGTSRTGNAIVVGDDQYPGTMTLECDTNLVAIVTYQANEQA